MIIYIGNYVLFDIIVHFIIQKLKNKYTFEENVFAFQYLNDKIHNYVLFGTIVYSKIEK